MEYSSRIIIFTTAFKPFVGGSELAIENIIRNSNEVFFNIITPLMDKNLKKIDRGENFCIHRVGWGWSKLLDKLFFPLAGFMKAIDLIDVHRHGIIHAYQASYGGGAGWLTKLFFRKVKFILTLQEGEDLNKQNFFIKFFRKLIIKKADRVTVISSFLKDYVLKIKPKARVDLIPNGVDLNVFKISRTTRPTNKIISVSRLVPKNGLDELIDAMPKVKSRIPDVKLTIIGEGQMRESLKLKIKNLKLEDSVRLFGKMKPEELPQYLNNASLFIRVSRSEGLGTAFLEAMAMGLPVLGTPVGGIVDFIKDGETGFLWDRNGEESLSDKIILLLEDENKLKIVSERGRKLVEEKYDWKIITKQMKNIYLNSIL